VILISILSKLSLKSEGKALTPRQRQIIPRIKKPMMKPTKMAHQRLLGYLRAFRTEPTIPNRLHTPETIPAIASLLTPLAVDDFDWEL
jgi:hypothetical protein